MILHLLPFGRFLPEERTSGQHQIGTSIVQRRIHQKIFLFGTEGRNHLGNILVKILANRRRSGIHCRDRTQQRRLVVQSLARIGHEHRRDAQGRPYDKSRRGRIPCRVSARLEGIAQPSVGERRGIGFLLDELCSIEALHGPSAGNRFKERIVLLGRSARERLEPMRVVCCAVVDGPLLHPRSHLLGIFPIDPYAALDGSHYRLESIFGQILAHRIFVKHIFPEDLRITPRFDFRSHRPVFLALPDRIDSEFCHND